MEWRCYAWAGGVVVLEFCPFLLIFPPMCISSVSPRFYFRKHAFCFLPLVTILESKKGILKETGIGQRWYCYVLEDPEEDREKFLNLQNIFVSWIQLDFCTPLKSS
jgi:hypothetical protein